jgi:hypothetical protein
LLANRRREHDNGKITASEMNQLKKSFEIYELL